MPTTPYLDLDSIHTPSVGGTPPASWGVAVRDNLEALARPPGCSVIATSISAGTGWSDIPFTDPDVRDTDGFHDPSNNPEQITIPSGLDGWYLFTGYTRWAANATGSRSSRLNINGTSLPVFYLPAVGSAAVPPTFGISTIQRLSAGDVVILQMHHSVSGNLDVSAEMQLTLVAWP